MKTSRKKYNEVMRLYEEKFNQQPPLTGAIYPVLTDEYVKWVEDAIKNNKVIDLTDYYPEGAHY
jgi:hypothetical protein